MNPFPEIVKLLDSWSILSTPPPLHIYDIGLTWPPFIAIFESASGTLNCYITNVSILETMKIIKKEAKNYTKSVMFILGGHII